MVTYMSMRLSQFIPTFAFPPFPQVCSLHLHLNSCLQLGSPVHFSRFYIYTFNIQYLFFLTSLCMTGSRFIHITSTYSISFNGWVIFHCGLPWCLQWRYWFDSWVGKVPQRRKWQPTPVFLPGKSHGQRSLAGYSPWGRKRVRHDLKDQTTNIPLDICTTTSLSTHLLGDT